MYKFHVRDWHRLFTAFSMIAGLFMAATLRAQSPLPSESDLLDQARRMDKVAAQKLEADLRLALREAERLARSDRAQAVERLKKALARLEDDTALSPQRRDSLKCMLKDRIRVTESATDSSDARVNEQDKKPAPSTSRRAEEDRRAGDDEKIRQGLKRIQVLQKDGKTEDANREASALARQHPKNTAVGAIGETALTAEQIANARRLQKERERRLVAAYGDIDKAATLPNGDVEFPKDWKERTKGRTTAVPLTAKEKSILQALNTTISVNFRNSKLEDVIEYLQTYTGQAILLDREGMKDAEVAYDTAITLNVKGVTVRTVLRKILSDLGMTYVVKEETIQATSAQKAREMMVVRRYYVGDLLANMSALGDLGGLQGGLGNLGGLQGGFRNFGGLPFAPAANPQLQAMHNMENVKHLIDLVQTSVDAQSWQANGGTGTISFHAPSMSLVITQSAEVHARLGSGGLLR